MSTSHPITTLGTPDQEQYAIVSATERQNQIKMIVRKELAVTAYIVDADGKKLKNFSTQLIGVNQEHNLLIFDTSPNDEINQLVIDTKRLFCATSIHDIPIEFELTSPKQAKLAGKLVFVSQLPENLIRMQRRQFFRVTIPNSISAVCYFQTADKNIKMEIHDISIGGLSIMIIGDFPLPFEMYNVYEKCEVQLSIGNNLKLDLEVRNHLKKPPIRKKPVIQVGFAFRNISEAEMNQIQRFIFNIESQRLRTR